MDYNDYDSNGNKKKFNLDLSDKKQRSRVILAAYAVIFLILIIIIRTSGITNDLNNTSNNNNNTLINTENTNTNDNNNNNNNNDNDNDFSFVNDKNYEFTITLTYDGKEYVSTGKRYNDKFDFDYMLDNQKYRFIGTIGNIKTYNNETEKYDTAHLPYFYINYYDNSVIKNVVSKSTLVEDTYEISDLELSQITGNSLLTKNNGINYIKLIKKNNKITSIEIDLSSVVTNSTNKTSNAIVKIDYKNFGLVEDFDINF